MGEPLRRGGARPQFEAVVWFGGTRALELLAEEEITELPSPYPFAL